MKKCLRIMATMLALATILMTLTGCGSDDKITDSPVATTEVKGEPTAIPTAPAETSDAVPAASQAIEDSPDEADTLDPMQRNSISMLNYLAVLTQEINASQNSRLYLEEAYSRLINYTNPNAVDNRTLSQLTNLLDTIEKYRMVATKRERLDYVYEQNRAQALRSVVPSPLGLMGAIQSFSLAKMAASVVYMTVDSVTSYTAATTQADMQYLQDGWALDDEAATALHNSRKDTFSYMVRIVSDYDLPGDLALSEADVEEFVKWENNDNAVQRILFLKSNVDTYRALGRYWLVLAESYYENGQYSECLNAVDSYEALETGIFRKDYEFARVLPLAVISAKETMSGPDYVNAAKRYITLIRDNTNDSDWISRYFVAQTYVDLYAQTGNNDDLIAAYEIVLMNVNNLINKQKEMNKEFLSKVEDIETPKNATKEQKADIKKYNDMLKEQRKTALPPIYEPLLLNCELLFALADELHVDEQNKTTIESILHQNGESIFLAAPLDQNFWFNQKPAVDVRNVEIAFDGKELKLPANLVCESSLIRVSVLLKNKEKKAVFEDWTIKEVKRETEGDIGAFVAAYTSAAAKEYKYEPGTTLAIEIMTGSSGVAEPVTFTYKTAAEKKLHVFDSIDFIRVK